jgi:hypothetical protein
VPAVAVGAVQYKGPHTLEEAAEADSITAGARMLVALAVCAAGVSER